MLIVHRLATEDTKKDEKRFNSPFCDVGFDEIEGVSEGSGVV